MPGSQCRDERTGDDPANSGAIEPSEHQQETGSVQNDQQGIENTEINRKNLGKKKIDALVLCGDDGMGVWTREASFFPKNGSLSTFPAGNRTGSL